MSGSRHVTIIVAGLCVATVYLLALWLAPELGFESVGARDFIQYWAACRVLSGGDDPYDPVAMLAAQRAVGMTWREPVMMWNPPWTLSALCPLFSGGFSSSIKLWLVLGAAMLAACALMSWKEHSARRGDYRLALCSAFLFVPALDGLSSGQLGILLGFSLCCFVSLQRASRPFFAGVSLAPLLFKPYLFHMLFIALVYRSARDREWRCLAGACAAGLALCAPIAVMRPEIFAEWWSGINAESFAIPALGVWQWKPDALSGELRAIFGGGADSRWIAFAVPAAADVLLLWALVSRRLEGGWERIAPGLAALSIFTAPYAWFSDQAALVGLNVGCAALACERGGRSGKRILVALFAVQVLLALSHVFWKTFWYPLAAALVWWRLAGGTGGSRA